MYRVRPLGVASAICPFGAADVRPPSTRTRAMLRLGAAASKDSGMGRGSDVPSVYRLFLSRYGRYVDSDAPDRSGTEFWKRKTMKTVSINLSPNQCRVLVLLLDHEKYTFEIISQEDYRAIRALKRKGYVVSRASVSLNLYALTKIGGYAARIAKELYA